MLCIGQTVVGKTYATPASSQKMISGGQGKRREIEEGENRGQLEGGLRERKMRCKND